MASALQPDAGEAAVQRSVTLASLLDDQIRTLRGQLDGVHDGHVDAVHDARVATRRIRELLALVPAVPGRDRQDDIARLFKKAGRALGRVRDLDVQLTLIRTLEDHTPQAAPALVLLRQEYEGERLAKIRKLIKTLERLDVSALLESAAENHPAGLRRRLIANGWRRQLSHLVVERARTAVDAIAHATGVYFPRRTHSARIAIKQLRYAAEIAEATGQTALRAGIKALRKGQELLGELHDRQSLADALDSYARGDDAARENIEVARHVLEREVMQLHAEYLERRTSLREACAEIREAACPAVAMRPAMMVGTALAVSGILYGRHRLAAHTES